MYMVNSCNMKASFALKAKGIVAATSHFTMTITL